MDMPWSIALVLQLQFEMPKVPLKKQMENSSLKVELT